MEKELLKLLLPLARWTLERAAAGEPWASGGPVPPPESDIATNGVFVTLKIGEGLRGCIGRIESQPSLHLAVRELTVQAAVHDPRFSPVAPEEVPLIDIGLSALTAPEELPNTDSIEIGRDGLIIERGSRRGLLLPEVALELGWSRQKYLEQICEKAFLPTDALQDSSCKLFRFHTVMVSEDSV